MMRARVIAAAAALLLVVALLLYSQRSSRTPAKKDRESPTSRSGPKSAGAPRQAAPGNILSERFTASPFFVPDSPQWQAAEPEEICRHQESFLAAMDPATLALTFSDSPERALFTDPLWLRVGKLWVPLLPRDYELKLVGAGESLAIGLNAEDTGLMISTSMASLPLGVPGMPPGTTFREALFEAYAVDGDSYECDPSALEDSSRLGLALSLKPLFSIGSAERRTVHADTASPDTIAWIRQASETIELELMSDAATLKIWQEGGRDVLAILRALRTDVPPGDRVLEDVSELWAGEARAARRLLDSNLVRSDATRERLEALAREWR